MWPLWKYTHICEYVSFQVKSVIKTYRFYAWQTNNKTIDKRPGLCFIFISSWSHKRLSIDPTLFGWEFVYLYIRVCRIWIKSNCRYSHLT